MNYKFLGRSGLRVSELCLGAMTFGEAWAGGGTSRDNSLAIFNAYRDRGGNFIDTANIYTGGTSEAWLGDFIGKDRHQFVIATKYTFATDPRDANSGGNHRKSLVRSVEDSLRRLKTDYIDLLYPHLWDAHTPFEEVMRALDDLVRAGKVLYLGASDFPAWVVSQSNVLAELKGWSRFIVLQIEYSLAERSPEADLIPMATAHGMSILDWSPLKMGMLTGKYLKQKPSEPARLAQQSFDHQLQANYYNDRANTIAAEVVAVAEELGACPAQIALAWIRQQHPAHIPILGARRLDQFLDNLACLDIQLEAAHLARLNQASQPELPFPASFLPLNQIQQGIWQGASPAQPLPKLSSSQA